MPLLDGARPIGDVLRNLCGALLLGTSEYQTASRSLYQQAAQLAFRSWLGFDEATDIEPVEEARWLAPPACVEALAATGAPGLALTVGLLGETVELQLEARPGANRLLLMPAARADPRRCYRVTGATAISFHGRTLEPATRLFLDRLVAALERAPLPRRDFWDCSRGHAPARSAGSRRTTTGSIRCETHRGLGGGAGGPRGAPLVLAWPGAGERGVIAEEAQPYLRHHPRLLDDTRDGVALLPPNDAPERARFVGLARGRLGGWRRGAHLANLRARPPDRARHVRRDRHRAARRWRHRGRAPSLSVLLGLVVVLLVFFLACQLELDRSGHCSRPPAAPPPRASGSSAVQVTPTSWPAAR